jgi:hypothetical protein
MAPAPPPTNQMQMQPGPMMAPQQPNQLMAPPQQMQPPQAPPPTPQQISDAHAALQDMAQTLDKLIKTPDSDLTVRHVMGAASDLVTKHRLTGGKRGASAIQVAQELASKDFPGEDDKGNPPSAAALRKFLQKHFDNAVMNRAAVTAHFGPAQPAMQNAPAQMPPMAGNQLTQPGQQ